MGTDGPAIHIHAVVDTSQSMRDYSDRFFALYNGHILYLRDKIDCFRPVRHTLMTFGNGAGIKTHYSYRSINDVKFTYGDLPFDFEGTDSQIHRYLHHALAETILRAALVPLDAHYLFFYSDLVADDEDLRPNVRKIVAKAQEQGVRIMVFCPSTGGLRSRLGIDNRYALHFTKSSMIEAMRHLDSDLPASAPS